MTQTGKYVKCWEISKLLVDLYILRAELRERASDPATCPPVSESLHVKRADVLSTIFGDNGLMRCAWYKTVSAAVYSTRSMSVLHSDAQWELTRLPPINEEFKGCKRLC